jgi:hypothetical protein
MIAAHAQPWENLAGLRGTADRCACSGGQLNLVGCDCDARQNLPVRCRGYSAAGHSGGCSAFLRTSAEIESGQCGSCEAMEDFNYVGSPHHY